MIVVAVNTNIQSHSLLECLVALLLGSILCITSQQYLFLILKIQHRIDKEFKVTHAKLILRHYICTDLQQAVAFHIEDDLLHSKRKLITSNLAHALQHKQLEPRATILEIRGLQYNVMYYLRRSVVPLTRRNQAFALYRDEIVHNSQALVEDIKNFTVHDTTTAFSKNIKVNILFSNNHQWEFTCKQNHRLDI